jgi:hypothetical protein
MADLLYVCEKAALQSHYQWTLLCNAEEQRWTWSEALL